MKKNKKRRCLPIDIANTVYNPELAVGIQTTGNKLNHYIPVMFENSSDMSIDIISIDNNDKVTQGVITNDCDYHPHPLPSKYHLIHVVPKIKLTFYRIKDTYLSKEKRSINYIYEDNTEYYDTVIYSDTPNNVIYDYCFSDANGNYTAYLEAGLYRLRVETPFKHYFTNFEVKEGLTNYYSYAADASIKQKIDDTILLYGTDKIQIVGCLFDEYNNPYAGQIIISQNNQLIAFINSEDGNYNFLLDYGTYDIRLRSDRQSVQIYYDYKFEPGKGFFTNLLRHKIVGYTDEQLNNLLVNNQLKNNLVAYNWTSRTR